MTNSPLLTSPAKLPHSSLSSAICIFPFSASSMPATESSMHCMHRVPSALPTGVSAHPEILTVLLVRVFVHSSGPGFTLFTCFSSVCIQFWSPHLRKYKREWKKVQRQAVRMLRGMGTDCTVNNHVGWDSSAWKKGPRVEEEVYKIMSGPERMGRIDCSLCLLTQICQLLLP